jgi:ankyrin repeat protein
MKLSRALQFSGCCIFLLTVLSSSSNVSIAEDGSEKRGEASEPVSAVRKAASGIQTVCISKKKRKWTTRFNLPIFWARFGIYPRNTTLALILAGSVGNMGTVVHFLENGSDIEGRGRDGETALIAAASAGQLAVASLLLASGADPRALDCRGESALDKAAERGDAEGRLLCMLLRRRLRELEPPPPPMPLPPLPPDHIPAAAAASAAAGTALRMAAAAAGYLFLIWAATAVHLFAKGHFDPWLIEH